MTLDRQIMSDASKISSEYVDLVSLATRQTMAAMEITVQGGVNGSSANVSDVKIFVKDTGTSQCVLLRDSLTYDIHTPTQTHQPSGTTLRGISGVSLPECIILWGDAIPPLGSSRSVTGLIIRCL